MKTITIKVSQIKDYLDMAKKEMEVKQALQNYARIKALGKASRQNLKILKKEFEEQRKKCEHYKPDAKLVDELSQVKQWK